MVYNMVTYLVKETRPVATACRDKYSARVTDSRQPISDNIIYVVCAQCISVNIYKPTFPDCFV